MESEPRQEQSLDEMLGKLVDCEVERELRRLTIHVAKNEVVQAVRVLHEIIRKVHCPQGKAVVSLDDPFAFICEHLRIVNLLEEGGYPTIRAVLGATDEELLQVRLISIHALKVIRRSLAEAGFGVDPDALVANAVVEGQKTQIENQKSFDFKSLFQ